MQSSFKNWQPPGCIMYEYERIDIQDCLGERRLIFIGDSTVHQTFHAVTKIMDKVKAEKEIPGLYDLTTVGEDIEFESGGVTTRFIWDPWLNSTGLKHELEKFKAQPLADRSHESAGLILLGAPGLWYARYGEENFFRVYREDD